MIARHGGELLAVDHPTTTLEELFLRIVRESDLHPGRRRVAETRQARGPRARRARRQPRSEPSGRPRSRHDGPDARARAGGRPAPSDSRRRDRLVDRARTGSIISSAMHPLNSTRPGPASAATRSFLIHVRARSPFPRSGRQAVRRDASGLAAPTLIAWLFVLRRAGVTIDAHGGLLGGLITWLKVVSLFCLLGWVVSWLVDRASRSGRSASGSWLDIAALVALVGGRRRPCCSASWRRPSGSRSTRSAAISVVDAARRWPACVVFFLWVEAALWATIRRLGRGGRPGRPAGHPPGARAGPGRRVRDPCGVEPGAARRRSRSPTWRDGAHLRRPDGRDVHGLRRPAAGGSAWCSARSSRSAAGGSTRSPG